MMVHGFLFLVGAALAFLAWRHGHLVPASRFAALESVRPMLLPGLSAFMLWQALCACWAIRNGRRKSKIILRLGGFAWNQNDFCRGWLITGETGSGKTLAVINNMLWQVTQKLSELGRHLH